MVKVIQLVPVDDVPGIGVVLQIHTELPKCSEVNDIIVFKLIVQFSAFAFGNLRSALLRERA